MHVVHPRDIWLIYYYRRSILKDICCEVNWLLLIQCPWHASAMRLIIQQYNEIEGSFQTKVKNFLPHRSLFLSTQQSLSFVKSTHTRELNRWRKKCVKQQKNSHRFQNEIFYVIYCSVDQTSFSKIAKEQRMTFPFPALFKREREWTISRLRVVPFFLHDDGMKSEESSNQPHKNSFVIQEIV